MSVRRHFSGPAVATCPVCGSTALSGLGRDEAALGELRWLIRCGECETWRAFDLAERSTRRSKTRLRWLLLRDRWRMTRELQHLEHTGCAPDLRELSAETGRRVRSHSDTASRP